MTNSDNRLPGARDLGLSAPTQDPCRAAEFEYMIGNPLPAPEALAALEGPKRVRVIRPGQPVTMDYLPMRLNIETDGDDIVVRLRCG